MGFEAVIAQGLKIIDSTTKSMQVNLVIKAWEGDDDGFGNEVYSNTPVLVKGFVEKMNKQIHNPDGKVVVIKAKVTILEEVPANGAADRDEPIDPRDQITLPDGFTGPIIDIKGLLTPATNQPYFAEVLLGETGGVAR